LYLADVRELFCRIRPTLTYTPEASIPCSLEMVCQKAAPIWLPFADVNHRAFTVMGQLVFCKAADWLGDLLRAFEPWNYTRGCPSDTFTEE
jgi:hypothetical protein